MTEFPDLLEGEENYQALKQKKIMRWEIKYFRKVLDMFAWNVSHAARAIKMDRANFYHKLRSLGIKRGERK